MCNIAKNGHLELKKWTFGNRVYTMPCLRELNLAEESFKIFVPEEYLVGFGVNHIENNPSVCVIELVEKSGRIPKVLAGKEVVLDGYNSEIDILTHAFSLKKIYLRFIHNRCFKEKGATKYYSNEYNLHISSMKTTIGDFLQLPPQTIYGWCRNYLSGYPKAISEYRWGKDNCEGKGKIQRFIIA